MKMISKDISYFGNVNTCLVNFIPMYGYLYFGSSHDVYNVGNKKTYIWMYILVDVVLSNQDHHNFSIICGRLPKKFSCQGQVHISYNPLLRSKMETNYSI